jgi:arylsulfatase A-like enzyme
MLRLHAASAHRFLCIAGIYYGGWFAGTLGPFIPWDTPGTAARLATWDATKDAWELYDLTKGFSQADNLADRKPERLATLQALFLREAKANKALPIGGGLWNPLRTLFIFNGFQSHYCQ